MNVCVRTLTAVVWKWFITLSVSNWGTGTSFRWPILLMICSDLDLLPHGTRETKLTMIWTRFTVISNIKLTQNFVFNENKIQTSLMTGVLFVSLRACQVWWQSPGGSRSPSKILPGDSQVSQWSGGEAGDVQVLYWDSIADWCSPPSSSSPPAAGRSSSSRPRLQAETWRPPSPPWPRAPGAPPSS